MLMGSNISPFDSPETKAYQNDPRISAMTELVDAYQRDDINRYEKVLQNNQDIVTDSFIAENIDEVTRNMRTKGVLKLVAPYTRFTLAFIAKQLKISEAEAQDIVGFLILDHKLKAKVDQLSGIVEKEAVSDVARMQAVGQWSSAVDSLWSSVLSGGEGFRNEDAGGLLGGSGGHGTPGLGDVLPPQGFGKISDTKSQRKGKVAARKLYTGA